MLRQFVRRCVAGTAVVAALVLPSWRLHAQGDIILNAKVVMEDGSPPPEPAGIERSCYGRNPIRVGSSNKRGEVQFREVLFQETDGECFWRAVIRGYVSDEVGMGLLLKSNNLPDFVLHSENAVVPAVLVPMKERAHKLVQAKQFSRAEAQLTEGLAAYPKVGPLWLDLGSAYLDEKRYADARHAFERAVELAPRYLPPYRVLAQLQINDGDWELAEKTALAGIKIDSLGKIPELQMFLAEIREHLKEDDAESPARKAVALDKAHKLPRAEYILGMILDENGDPESAWAHLRRYLELEPKAPEAAAVRARIRELQVIVAQAAEEAAAAGQDKLPQGPSQVTVPGGLRAVAAIARMKSTPAPEDFFLMYCRAVADAASPGDHSDNPDFSSALEAYFAAIPELAKMPQNRDGQITLSPDFTPGSRTIEVLKIFGWKGWATGVGSHIEPGELPADGPRQPIPGALGIDEVEMVKSLTRGSSYHFTYRSEQALLLEAGSWLALARQLPPGGFAEMFLRNPHFAAGYAALAGMGPGAAAAVISGVGLRAMVNRYASVARLYGESFAVAGGRAASPGGPGADPAWERLAGASPRDPKAFFAALLAKDQGSLAAFYSTLAGADAAHQRFFTRNPATAAQFYAWYRDSDELRARLNPLIVAWRGTLLQEAPLDSEGNPRFPGGAAAWGARDDASGELSPTLPALQALVPIASLERDRKTPFDAESVRLLAAHYSTWRPLFPYFATLPGLGAAEFQALAAFEASVNAQSAADRNGALGEWHSLVKLVELGERSGSLDAAAAARAFRRACEAASARDHSAQSVAALREMTGGAQDLDEAVPDRLLRLDARKREAFDRVKAIERTPGLASLAGAPSGHVLPALVGHVYAALLDPDMQLVSEDPQLPARHAFAGDGSVPGMFAPSGIQTYHEADASRFVGGFTTFEQIAAKLPKARPPAPDLVETAALVPVVPDPVRDSPDPAPVRAPAEATFRVRARMVEVYATVTDEHGKYVDDLHGSDFKLLDNGAPVQVSAFENHSGGFSLALVLDTTGSMVGALPALKAAALRVIDNLRPVDNVAVYSFNQTVSELQAFTDNKDLAKRAVLHTRASGPTALNDALVSVSRELSARPGKKAIVVFTDGADNTSGLNADAAIRRAKTDGVVVYTVAHGDALHNEALTAQLEATAKATGGLAFSVQDADGVRAVFEHIVTDLMHGYLLAFQPDTEDSLEWHSLQVLPPAVQTRKVRAREGYFPQ